MALFFVILCQCFKLNIIALKMQRPMLNLLLENIIRVPTGAQS